MFRHPDWAVDSCSGDPPAAGRAGTKSSGDFLCPGWSPCTCPQSLDSSETSLTLKELGDILQLRDALAGEPQFAAHPLEVETVRRVGAPRKEFGHLKWYSPVSSSLQIYYCAKQTLLYTAAHVATSSGV